MSCPQPQTITGVLDLLATVAENAGYAKVQKRRTGRFTFAAKPDQGFIEVVVSDSAGVTVSRTAWTVSEFAKFVEAAEEIHHVALRSSE
jgi:hypothetical protein